MKMNDVDFLIIGAAKCATTWLQVQLQSEPTIYMPDPELHYFSREYDQGDKWYLDQFKPHHEVSLVGEKSNSYLSDPKAAPRIHSTLPNIKLIVQLRNPIDRAYSDYCMLFRRGTVGPDIENYLDPNKTPENRFINDGNYAPQLQAFIDLYGKDNILILDFQNVVNNPVKQIIAMREHLGLDSSLPTRLPTAKVKDKAISRLPPHMRRKLAWLKPFVKPLRETKAFNIVWGSFAQKPNYPHLSPELRSELLKYYGPSIAQLENMTDFPLQHWK